MFKFIDPGWKKLLKLYFDLDVSNNFIECAFKKLANAFIEQTGMGKDKFLQAVLIWQKEDGFTYQNGTISKLSSHINLKYGKLAVFICWRSKSGYIYELHEENIDCADLEFWFEGLEVEKCKHLMFPKWTLITFKDDFIERLAKRTGIPVSNEFIRCADAQLSDLFRKQTGLSLTRHISLSYDWTNYSSGAISCFQCGLYLNAFRNEIKICWKTVSGKEYKFIDANINCNDIIFWFEGLSTLEYHRQIFPSEPLPFKLEEINYKLIVERLNVHCNLTMTVKKSFTENYERLLHVIDEYLAAFNAKSQKKGGYDGVVHNWTRNYEGKEINYEIDWGSASIELIKNLLIYLSKLDAFDEVRIT